MITVTGIGKLRAKATTKVKRMAGPAVKKAVEQMADEVLAEYRGKEESFVPGSVADLDEKYKKRKQKKFGQVYPILQASGQMMNSMFHKVTAAGSRFSIFVGFKGRHAGTKLSNEQLVKIHTGGEGTQPVRNFLKLSRGFTTKWTRRILAVLRKQG